MGDDDDETGLFSELYSENPEPINPNATEETETNHVASIEEAERSEVNSQSEHDFLSRLTSTRPSTNISIPRTDSFPVSPTRISRSNSDTSSRRDAVTSPRRNGVLGRLFRR